MANKKKSRSNASNKATMTASQVTQIIKALKPKPQPSIYKSLGKGIGYKVGSYLGNSKKYSKYGEQLGGAVSKIMGHGDYSLSSSIKKNSILTNPTVPYMHSVKDGFTIRHREYIGDIFGSIGFNTSIYPVNPGLSASFPWLAQVAGAFEQYSFSGIVYEFVSSCGNALSSSNNALGIVAMSADYNVANGFFINLQECQNSMFCASGKPSTNIMLPIECDKAQNPMSQLYTRSTALLANQNIQFYDLCNVQVSTQGQQVGGINLGQLWVTYDIKFFKSVLNPSSAQLTSAHYTSVIYTNALPIKGAYKTFDSIGVLMYDNTIQFPMQAYGTYQISILWYGPTAATVSIPAITYSSNVTVYNTLSQGSLAAYTNNGQSSTKAFFTFFVKILDDGETASILFGSGTLPQIGVQTVIADYIIAEVDYNFI